MVREVFKNAIRNGDFTYCDFRIKTNTWKEEKTDNLSSDVD